MAGSTSCCSQSSATRRRSFNPAGYRRAPSAPGYPCPMHPLAAEPAPPLPRRRTWAAGIGWALLFPVLLLLGLRLSGVSVGTPWVQLLSLTPVFLVPALGALLFFALARRVFPAVDGRGIGHRSGGAACRAVRTPARNRAWHAQLQLHQPPGCA